MSDVEGNGLQHSSVDLGAETHCEATLRHDDAAGANAMLP